MVFLAPAVTHLGVHVCRASRISTLFASSGRVAPIAEGGKRGPDMQVARRDASPALGPGT